MSRRAEISEFQPDALALEERETPPRLRATLYVLAALLLTGLVWSAVGTLDVIVDARGRLTTDRANLVVQPLETSVIRTIHVQPGDTVTAGQLLVTLDPTFADADAVASRGLLDSLVLQSARLQAELSGSTFDPPPTGDPTELAVQREIHTRRLSEYQARLSAYGEELAEIDAQTQTRLGQIASLERQQAIIAEVVQMRRTLMDREFGSRLNFLQAQAQANTAETELIRLRDELAEFPSRRARVIANREGYIAEWRRKAGEELQSVRRERDRMYETLRKLERRASLVSLTSPADAVVLEVAARSEGSVVREAETLITLVPLDVPLEAQVDILPRDIGRVSVGDPVRLKLEALPFQKHGTLTARIAVISEDTIERQAGDRTRRVYSARLEITGRTLENLPENFRLLPGMNVEAEIKAGQRTILSYLMYPIIRGLDESMQEP